MVEGVAVSMRGAAAHPYSQGELCPKVNRYLDRVYHPDRILTPLRRTGPKGTGEFEPISWTQAVEETADRLRSIITDHGGESIARWSSAGTQGMIQCTALDRIFFARLGASQPVGSVCGLAAREGFSATYGGGKGADPMDIEHSKLIILWGTNTRLTNRHLWPFITKAKRNGARVVVIDCMRTMTADAADQFIQPLPGTDVALILSVAHVIIRDGLIDRDYVEQHTEGFDRFAAEAAEWTPERAAAACGVDADVIEALATEYATTAPAMIRTLIGAEHHAQGAMFFRALGVLPLLTGSWKVIGGGLSRSVGNWASANIDDARFDVPSDARELNVNDLGRHLAAPESDIHGVFIWNGNPLVSTPAADLFRRGLDRDDLFCVVSEQFMTDTAKYADIIFPATTQIEQFDVVPAWGHLYLGWNEAAIEPCGEAVPNTELWRRLAAAMGFDDPEFAMSDLELIESSLVGIAIDDLRRDGWPRLSVPESVLPYASGCPSRENGKALIWDDDTAVYGQIRFVNPFDGIADDQFVLQTPKRHVRFLNSTYSAHHGSMETTPSLEMHSDDVTRLGLAEGEPVVVHNDLGQLSLPLRTSDRVRPGVVSIPWGWWGREFNVNALTSDAPTDWGGGAAYGDTVVRVARAADVKPVGIEAVNEAGSLT